MSVETLFRGAVRQLRQAARYLLERWRDRDGDRPGESAHAAYARATLQMVREGRAHATIGGTLKHGQVFGSSGREPFELLLQLGLQPGDVVVDYGCGTLRVGVHLIRHLEPGRYWGLDVDAEILAHGRRLVGDELLGAKTPELRVIDDASIAAAAAARPAWVLSRAVMLHVPPHELPDYVAKIASLVTADGRAIIFVRTAERAFRFSTHKWIHATAAVAALVQGQGLVCRVLASTPGRARFRRHRYETLLLTRREIGC